MDAQDAGLGGDESAAGQAACACGGLLEKCGKSKRGEGPPDGYRSDSSGSFDNFPTQRSSGSGLAVLRLPRPAGLRRVKIFSHFSRRPPHAHAACPAALSGFGCGWTPWFWLRMGALVWAADGCSGLGCAWVFWFRLRMGVLVWVAHGRSGFGCA